MSIVVTGYPSTDVLSYATSDSYDSSELIKYLCINVSDFPSTDEYLEVVYNSETITIWLVDECRYTPVPVHFINKDGAQQVIHFYKARKDELKTDRETYESDRNQPANGNHQFVDYNVNGRTSFTVNSGYVDEDMNDTFKQLMLSETVWILENNDFIPVNISKKNLKYKNRQNDRLINYEFEFEYSYNEINNI